MASDATLRDSMNQSEPGRQLDVLRDIQVGDLLNALVAAMSATEAGVSASSQVCTLAGTPTVLWDAKIATGGTTGSKKVLRVSNAFLTANSPPVGSCFWDGSTKVKFNATDNCTTADFKYPKAADATVGYFQRALGQQDG